MPRPNPSRQVQVEERLRHRLAIERERRGWSPEGLAQRLTAAGCPIQTSAIYKIEKGNPPRRITVDELVAFATVFDMSTTDLLRSATGARPNPHIGHDLVALEQLFRRRADLLRQLDEIEEQKGPVAQRLREAVLADVDERTAFRETIDEDFRDWPEFLGWSGISDFVGSTTRKRRGGR